jgi:hypothetical protein
MRREAESKNQIRTNIRPETSDKISELHKKYPWLSPGVLLAASKGNVSQELLDAMSASIATMANEDPDKANGKDKGNWFSSAVKGATRLTFAAFDTSKELFQNIVAKTPIPVATEYVGAKVQQATGQTEAGYGGPKASDIAIVNDAASRQGEGGFGEFIGSTTLASLARNWENQGSGYFVSENIVQEQRERAKKFRGTTQGGHAWTPGRGFAGMVFNEDSYAYNLMSGFVDGAVAVKIPVAPGVAFGLTKVSELAAADDAGDVLRQAGRVADTLQGRGQVIKISDMTGEELREARRLAGLVGDTVDVEQANAFLGTRAGRRLVERLVDANTTDDVRRLLGRNLYADTVKQLRDAKNEFEVQAVLADVLGKPQAGLASTKGVKGVKKVALSNARRLKMMESLDTQVGLKIKRGLGYKPGRMFDMSSTNPADVRRTLNQIDDWAKTTLMDEETRRTLLDKAVDAMVGDTATPTARKAFKEEFEQIAVDSLVKNSNVDKNVAAVVLLTMPTRMKKVTKWALGPDGVPDDAGFLKNATRVGDDVVDDASFGGAMLSSELADVIVEMPDPRQVRAISNRFNKIWRYKPKDVGPLKDANLERLAKAGTLRPPFSAVMWAQDKLFRRLILMTGGYSVRNLTEAQLRIALSYRNVEGVFDHPASWLGWATHKKGAFDITGEAFDYNTLTDNMRTFREAVQAENFTDFGDPTIAYRRGKRIGYFDEVDRTDPQQFDLVVEAHGDQIGLLNADPVARRVAGGATDEEILVFLRTDPEGKAWFRNQQDYHINGRPTFEKTTRGYKHVGNQQVDLNVEENLLLHIKEIRTRIEYQTGGDTRLKNVIAQGQLPVETVVIANQTVAGRPLGALINKNDEGQALMLEYKVPGSNRPGTRQVRVQSVDEATGEAVVVPFAFERGEASLDLRKLLEADDVYYNPKLTEILPHEIRVDSLKERPWDAGWDDMTDRAFAFLYGKPSRYLDRSPLFRQFYYSMAIDQLLTSLSIDDAIRLHDNIVESAAKVGRKPEFYLGDKKRWQRIQDAKDGKLPMQGTLTLEEVDDFAKGQALDELKGLLYDASNVRNSMDAARVVFPFANAFVEFYKSIGRAYTMPTLTGVPLPNLKSLRKTQLVVDGGRDADPDGDGRGYFFVDPETQEWSFTYPGSGFITKSLLGLTAPLTAPIAGALQGVGLSEGDFFGLKTNPGLGPVVNVPASFMFSKVLPDTDFVRSVEKFFLPFGKTEFTTETGGVASGVVKSFLPAWSTKIMSAVFDDPQSLTAFGNAAFETRQALLATGEYDLNNFESMKQLEEDTNYKARWLTVIRAAGQFTGPSRPSSEFKTKVMDGDVYINQAIADLRRWQLEDYDSAILRFLDTYGDDFWAYLARKTSTGEFEALGTSADFGSWERDNPDFLREFPNVASYFAPVGTGFDYFVYTGQIGKGMRRRETNKASFNAAQYYVVGAQMRLANKLIGDNPTPEQEEELDAYRKALESDYPGAKSYPFNPNKLPNQIEALYSAAFVSSMDGNPVAEGTRLYLQQRTNVLAQVESTGQGLGAKKNLEYRNLLRASANIIIEEYPEFERLWERVLSRELDR